MNLISVMEFFGKYAKHASVIYIYGHVFLIFVSFLFYNGCYNTIECEKKIFGRSALLCRIFLVGFSRVLFSRFFALYQFGPDDLLVVVSLVYCLRFWKSILLIELYGQTTTQLHIHVASQCGFLYMNSSFSRSAFSMT